MPGRPPPRLPAADASTGMAASHRHTDEYMARFYAALSLDAADVDPHALAHEPAFSTAPNAQPLGSGARSTGVADPPLGPPPLLSGSAALAYGNLDKSTDFSSFFIWLYERSVLLPPPPQEKTYHRYTGGSGPGERLASAL